MFLRCGVFIILTLLKGFASGAISFASYYEDHMVLQAAPGKAVVWGYADVELLGENITVTIGSQTHTSIISEDGVWNVTLDSSPASDNEFTLTARAADQTIQIEDVLFGDVWICSGQSNMELALFQIDNGDEEIDNAVNFSSVRYFKVADNAADSPLKDLDEIALHWSQPETETVAYFSGLCWIFGRRLNQATGRPVGLIQSSVGGTPIEAWSPPEVFTVCDMVQHRNAAGREAQEGGELWNSMIHPLLSLSIKGAIWYQGESNRGNAEEYNCTFPAMIQSWRRRFHEGSGGQTSETFPFGFVQLAPFRNEPSVATGFPDVRWAQTTSHGYVPNPDQQNVFMAVAMDLPDFDSPFGSIHPRYKQEIGRRLALGGLSLVYGQSVGRIQGPLPTSTSLNGNLLAIVYDEGKYTISKKVDEGFEVCCSMDNEFCESSPTSFWELAPIVTVRSAEGKLSVDGTVCGEGYVITGLRYAWRESPCLKDACAVYSGTDGNNLPAPPFVIEKLFTK